MQTNPFVRRDLIYVFFWQGKGYQQNVTNIQYGLDLYLFISLIEKWAQGSLKIFK